ncbi:0969b19a-6e5e-4b3e-b0d8-ea056ed1c3c3 [Thermothielavioides terrestris]|uniref:0969b19a-6e5e-4b3e-b0d8-ea056ed1c3c3 n=1 Tax=Thermothielavioides terrestris TaxID=2587410 RepID=A0A446BCL7_9PEZI|nr:0969b19a-6e5e-4b3e-b0d8-ea056ed1c3c3 [Thermothielavioides terrestris]
MASVLRQIVAGPRAKHQETGLDLCYVTSNIIVTSGPSQTYPQRAYRNPLDRLVAFLDARHGRGWAIWEFRAEGTGYPDQAVHGRISHYPWPDHHPPPFRLVPVILGGMRRCYLIAECGWTAEDALARFTERRMRPGFGAGVSIPSQLRWVRYVDRWTKGGKKYVDRAVEIVEVHVWGLRHGVKVSVQGFVDEGKKIRVFHTFKGDERIVVEGDAPGGRGVVDMVQDMAGYGAKATVDDKGEILEDADYEGITKGVVDNGNNGDGNGNGNGNGGDISNGNGGHGKASVKKAKALGAAGLMRKLSTRRQRSSQSLDRLGKKVSKSKTIAMPDSSQSLSSGAALPSKDESRTQSTTSLQNGVTFANPSEPGGRAVIFKPATPICIPNSDVNISIERRNRAPAGMGFTMVTAVAHVWFNAFFEGQGPEQDGRADESGVFEIEWDKMDGLKGSSQKGTRALERLSVVWRVAGTGAAGPEGRATAAAPGVAIDEPGVDSPVPQMAPADWKGGNAEDPSADKHLGLRVEDPESQGVSKASSLRSQEVGEGSGPAKGEVEADEEASLEGVKVSGPTGEEILDEVSSGQGPPSMSST